MKSKGKRPKDWSAEARITALMETGIRTSEALATGLGIQTVETKPRDHESDGITVGKLTA